MSKKEIYIVRNLLILGISIWLSGCAAFSATTLRCGIDGDSSYVELLNFPQDMGPSVKYYSDICGFTFEGDDNGVSTQAQ